MLLMLRVDLTPCYQIIFCKIGVRLLCCELIYMTHWADEINFGGDTLTCLGFSDAYMAKFTAEGDPYMV